MGVDDLLNAGVDAASAYMKEKTIEETIGYLNRLQSSISGTSGDAREMAGREYRDALIHLGVQTRFAEVVSFVNWYKLMFPHDGHKKEGGK